MTTVTFTSSGSWSAPAGISSIDCQCWAEGGNGGNGTTGGSSHSGGGGGGGEYAEETTLAVTPASNYPFTIGAGGSTTNTVFAGDSVTVTAHHGGNTLGQTAGTKGTGSTNSIHHDGGAGGTGILTTNPAGGGGGGGAGSSSAGGTGGNGFGNAVGASGGSAGSPDGGAGGKGGNGNSTGNPGANGNSLGGGGGGGSGRTGGTSGGSGAGGQISLTYTAAMSGTATLAGVGTLTAQGGPQGTATLSGVGTLSALRTGAGNATLSGVGTMTPNATLGVKASISGVGTMSTLGGLPTATIVNQWANSYGQGTTFGSTTSALQSCVVPLNLANSVGVGSGTPTAGNWLFCIASWTQDPQIINVHTGVSDDTHQWWRQFPASGSGGNVRTGISYVPNIGMGATNTIVPQYVYCAPDMSIAAINVLVVEIAGLGPWDTVTARTSNYTSSGTSVSLSLGAPSQAGFTMGAVGGDNVASGQAFAPATWTTLVTQTQSNGVDTTCDNILTAAFLPSTLGTVSVSGTSSSSEDLSGILLQVLVSAASPVPASQNPNWPYTKFEAAFGGGFNTPNSELTWTDLTNRLWSWDETTGIQYQLGQLQSTNLALELDNFDGALTPSATPWSFSSVGTPTLHNFFTVTTANAASISVGDGFTDTVNSGTFFTVTSIGAPSGGNVNITFSPSATNIMTSDTISQVSLIDGTPIRMRFALGTFGGRAINRWYSIQRNSHEWEGQLTSVLRRWAPVTGTDIWSAMSAVAPTFYRSEIYEDNPYAWYPMDDQPLEGGVLPLILLNAASGNTTVMNIIPSPNGITAQDTYGFNGVDITAKVASNGFFGIVGSVTPPAGSVATYGVGVNSGWMYGDPVSSPSAIASSGNPVQASPGSASWQQSGMLGSTGSHGWFLSANDNSFPGLSGGVTVKGWFNVGLQGSGSGYNYFVSQDNFDNTSLTAQPFTSITICELATASAPVCVLQLDSSGHLNLITYNGATGTSHSIYSASDLRSGAWNSVDILLTSTTWQVLLNGGITANVSGSATGMTSAWKYLILCGDMGSGGGANTSNLVHGGNMALSHWAVFSYLLPVWRLLAHYTAAITGFGLIPAPIVSLAPVSSPPGAGVSLDFSGLNQTSDGGYQTTPDGAFYSGSYGGSPGNPPSGGAGSVSGYTFSLIATANAGAYSSGPSARTSTSGIGQVIQYTTTGINQFFAWPYAMWMSWVGLAPVFTVYTSASVGTEKLLETIVGSGDSVQSGFGTGASPPSAATPLGDSVGERIERLMRAGRCTTPQRSIDPAPDLVQAPGFSGGGQQAGSSVQAIQQSDGGMLYVDNQGNLTYWMRDHLASQYSNPVWTLTPNAPPTAGATTDKIPYYEQYQLVNDPQRIYNVITVQPFSPSGAQLPLLTPNDAVDVLASQVQHGAQPLSIVSWLQDQTVMQSQANWLFTNFGSPQTRAQNVHIDAAPYPPAWNIVASINIGDVLTLEEWQIGGGGEVLTLRVTEINRRIRFGGQNNNNAGDGEVVANIELICDFEPPSYY